MGEEMLSTPLRCRSDPASLLAMSAFHDFEMTSITGEQVSFDQFRGQICLIVNVASA
jgi:Glutathione peroxidase